jgi:hypothetical protein
MRGRFEYFLILFRQKMVTSLRAFPVLLSLLLTAIPASADRVIPSSRVTSHLNVRAQPNVNSSVVGILRPNESAELVDSVPYWYHVRLDDGTIGFVSKAWATIISEAQETGEVIRLGSWNIKKLGHGTSKDYNLVARVIESNFDIVVVVEVMQKQEGHPGYDALLSELGTGWVGLVTDSPRPNTTSGNAEFYAILYRIALVHPCSGWNDLIYYPDNDGSGTDTGPDLFSREPAYGCFEAPLNVNDIGVDFLIAGYHARWAGGNRDEIKAEVDHIDDVFTAMAAARPGEGDIIIAGDYNLVPADLRAVVSVDVTTQGTGSTLNSSGGRTSNLYDHLLVHDRQKTSEMIGDPEVIDVLNVAADNKAFFDTVSDHLPVVVRLRASGPDDD